MNEEKSCCDDTIRKGQQNHVGHITDNLKIARELRTRGRLD